MSPRPIHLVELFQRRVAMSGGRVALRVKRGRAWQPVCWNELADDVYAAAAALRDCGVAPGDRVLQLSENRYEWIVADLAILVAGAVHVPVHAPLTGEQVAWQIADSGAKLALVSTAEQLQKVASVRDRLPGDLQILAYDPAAADACALPVQLWSEVVAACGAPEKVAPIAERAGRLAAADSLATILYTSGTTGEPKGVCLTHGNLVSNTLATLAMFEQGEDDVRVNFLPLSHIFARTCDLYTWMASGSELALAESRESVIADCQAICPTHVSGVPYFYEKIARGLTAAGLADSPGAVRNLLGGRIRMCAAGGAALPDHVFDFFGKQQVPLCQGYGLSESSPVITVNPPCDIRRGSAGRAIPGVEVRIADDGEILTRGPHVMQGYWNNPAATADALDAQGWLHTGDLGHLSDGYLYITGRKKELLVLNTGKKVAPVLLESRLTADPLFLQAMVVGEGQSHVAALIVPDLARLRGELSSDDMKSLDDATLVCHPLTLAHCRQRIDERLSGLASYEQIGPFALLTQGFTLERGELTPKLSLRRQVVAANYAAQIADLYAC